jgi:ribosomal protein RSM22 (predicted rRNA methylase)
MRYREDQQRANKGHLTMLVERNTQELYRLIDVQHSILLSILNGKKDDFPFDLCSLADCPHRRLLRQILTETIEVLEETKKAFKSKRLEGLRKKLLHVLMETA